VEVTDRNIELTMTMSSGADISGRIVTMDGTPLPPRSRIIITSRPLSGLRGGAQIAIQDPSGRFLIPSVTAERQRVEVMGLPSKFYVKEIRYNGQIIADGVFTPIPGAPGQLDIMIDDQAANISGSVAGRDNLTGRVMVVAVKWPTSLEGLSLFQFSVSVPADDQGRFQIGGMAPGEYRIFALTEGSIVREIENAATLLNQAEKVKVERGSSQSISLKIIEP
jgi:hypothetical protein